MRGRVYSKKTPCWLWHTISHETGDVISYVLGTREKTILCQLNDLLYSLNLNISSVYSDNDLDPLDDFDYHDFIPPDIFHTGKINTQKIQRKPLTFQTRLKRLVRKTIRFSKSLHMHKIMIGLLINPFKFKNKLLST